MRIVPLPTERANSNPCGFDHDQIAIETMALNRNDLENPVNFGSLCQSIQFDENDAANGDFLTNDQLAKIAIFSDHYAAVVRGCPAVPLHPMNRSGHWQSR
jgi:hypothetical protein